MEQQPQVYAVKHKDEAVRASSRSGGVFTALSDLILSENGIVYGCVLNEKFEAEHIRAENENDRNKMRGSKYIQSNLGNTFKQVKNDLQDGKKVLFSGTSCQIAGLKSFLVKDYTGQLLCVDIVCHGVPSPLVWKKYLEWQEEKHNGKIINGDFRNKKDFGWRDHVETLYFKNGRTINSRVFKSLFYSHTILRPSCYECPYKSVIHPGDITIGDYWGIEKSAPKFDDNKGVSLVLVNNEKGNNALMKVKKFLTAKQTKLEDSLQTPLIAPFPRPQNRNQFWSDFKTKPFKYIAQKYSCYGVKAHIRIFFIRVKRKIKKLVCNNEKRNPTAI